MLISKRTMSTLIIFSFLILSFTTNSSTQATTIGNPTSLASIEQTDNPVDYKVVQVDSSQDINKDHIQDSFHEKLVNSDTTASFDAILSFTGPITKTDRLFLQNNGIEIITEYDVIYAAHVRGTAESLLLTKNLDSGLFLEENSLSHALLLDVTETFGVRKVWQTSQGYGYTGNPDTAIAVLDTGVDDSHPDSDFNVIYWNDYEGASYLSPGDEYATPTDKGEHGTHVASIAASAGASVSTSVATIQDSGYLPTSDGYAWYYTWFYIYTAQSVTINWAWEGSGSTFVGFWSNTLGDWSGQSASDSSSPGTFSYYQSTPGWYCAMYGNSVGATGRYFSGEVIYDPGWTNPYFDSYGPFTGVAPSSNIVALKVLDDTGTGTSTSLINALNWLYLNGQSYNITVVNMSLGWTSVISSIDSAVSSLVRDKGIVCVVAAGNDGTSSGGVYSPGSCLDAITVGSVNKASEIAYYSSNGYDSQGFIKPDVVAPGGSFASSGSSAPAQPIIAADSNDADEAYDYNTATSYPPKTDYYADNYRGFQGTSMASPFVAGLVQLVVDAMIEEGTYSYSWETAKKIKQVICMSASEVYNIEGSISTGGETYDGDSDGIPQLPTWNRDSKDYVEGYGVISVEGAVQAVTDWLSVGTTELVSLSGRQYGTHTAVRQINLEADTIYRLYGEFNLGTFTDADVFIYATDPDQYGEPTILAELIQGFVTDESTVFTVPDDGVYYLVAKWADGVYDGACNVLVEEVVQLKYISDGASVPPNSNIDFDIDDYDLTLVEYKIDSGAYAPLPSPYTVVLPGPDGTKTITIRVQHNLGTSEEQVFTFIVDTGAPPINTETSVTRILDFPSTGILLVSVMCIGCFIFKMRKRK